LQHQSKAVMLQGLVTRAVYDIHVVVQGHSQRNAQAARMYFVCHIHGTTQFMVLQAGWH